MFKQITIVILLIFISSCCDINNKTYYYHDNIVITRIDKCGETSFYYNDNCRIWCEYSGINAGFSGYLRFEEDGKVTLISSDGYFQSENKNCNNFTYRRNIRVDETNLGNNTCCILLSTRYEQERNIKYHSKIKIEYK